MKDYNCETHGPYSGDPVEVLGRVWEVQCPTCSDEFEAKLNAENLVIAKREAREAFVRSMTRSNVEVAYWEVSLDTFTTETDEQKRALRAVRDLVDGKIKKVIMAGKNGTGKTHLACAAIKVLGGKIMSMYEISTTIRASYTAKAKETELEIVDALARLPLLVIDEMGRTKGGEAEQNWLSYILDKRHVRDLPTALITNKHVKKDCAESKGCADCLENYISDDVMSRLSENGVLLRFTGEDWRKK